MSQLPYALLSWSYLDPLSEKSNEKYHSDLKACFTLENLKKFLDPRGTPDAIVEKMNKPAIQFDVLSIKQEEDHKIAQESNRNLNDQNKTIEDH